MYRIHILSDINLFEKIWLCFVSLTVISQLAGTCMDTKYFLWWKSTRIFWLVRAHIILTWFFLCRGLACLLLFLLSKKLYLYFLCCIVQYICITCDIVVHNLVCKFREKNKIVITIYAWSFFLLKKLSSVCVYWCTSICYICGDNMIESDELWAKFEVFTSGSLLADWK